MARRKQKRQDIVDIHAAQTWAFRRLSAAIVINACREAHRGDRQAREWLENSQLAEVLLTALDLPEPQELLVSLDEIATMPGRTWE